MPGETQAHIAGAHSQPFVIRLRDALPVKQKLKLHAPSLKRAAPLRQYPIAARDARRDGLCVV